jgi:hypothetical protein
MNTQRWDQLYDALSAQPRRMLVFSLLKEPAEAWLPLPDAARASEQGPDAERLRIQLRHHHLPMLADAGYVRWESDPFRVRRGPHFDEPALVVSRMIGASEEYPDRLRDECVVLGGVEADGSG